MSKLDKLIDRLCQKPKDFTWDELEKLLFSLGYRKLKKGKTSGSRRRFYNEDNKKVIELHEPHPENILKPYAITDLIQKLEICKKK